MKYPDTKRCYGMLKAEFLELNGIKIGDIIDVEFDYQTLYTPYKKTKAIPRRNSKVAKGVVKENSKIGIYVESLEDFTFYEFMTNGLTGRQRKEWYRRIERKAIKKIFSFGI